MSLKTFSLQKRHGPYPYLWQPHLRQLLISKCYKVYIHILFIPRNVDGLSYSF